MRLTSHKGFGLFATQDIPRGTCIVTEPSLITVPPSEPDCEHIWKAFKNLKSEQHDHVCGLFVPTTVNSCLSGHVRRKLLRHQYTSVSLIAAVEDELKMRTVFSSNCMDMGFNGQYGQGLFLIASRLQHSCVPNVQQGYNATLKMSTVYVTRDVKEGEELTRSYIQHVYNDYEQRADLLSRWNFKCDCVACLGPQAALRERRLRRITEHVTGLEMYDMGAGSFAAPSGPREAVAWAEEVVGLMKMQGVDDLELARA